MCCPQIAQGRQVPWEGPQGVGQRAVGLQMH